MSINEFLISIQSKLQTGLVDIHPIFVVGNDSADLDSIISAVLLAYFKQQHQQQQSDKASNTLYIPLVKVPFCDLALRPEVTFVLEQAGIDPSRLICIDRVSDILFNKGESSDIILVDHNRATSPLTKCRVLGIVDHHVDENMYLDAPLRWIETVGSCTSQVILLFKDNLASFTDTQKKTLAKLAVAPILVDTIGLRWELGKTTQKDMDAFHIVGKLAFLDGTNYTANLEDTVNEQSMRYYEAIEAIKSQVNHLSSRDLLRKDYKEWVVNGYTVGTSSMAWYLKGWIDRSGYDQILHDSSAFMEERNLDMLVVLTSYDHSKRKHDGKYERELAFFVKNDQLLQVKREMEENKNVGLTDLLPQWSITSNNEHVGFYHQHNIKLSRKQIWPLLQDLLLKQQH